jgi:hypothetical protein
LKKAYSDYKKYCEEESYNGFSNKAFGLRWESVADKVSATKNRLHYRYYLIKDNIKNKYKERNDVEIDLEYLIDDP